MTTSSNKVLMSWSTGKDSAYALYRLKQLQDKFEITGLLTTLTKPFDRTSIHGVRRKLLEEQAKQMGLLSYVVEIPYPCTNETYEFLMKSFLATQETIHDISFIAFGDIFLEDVRRYRETKLSTTFIQPLFPLWHENTQSLAYDIIETGFKAIITCVNPKKLDRSFVGRIFDRDFLKDLPGEIDPCGENGEFHTFVYDAPLFRKPINISTGTIVERDGLIFTDIVIGASK